MASGYQLNNLNFDSLEDLQTYIQSEEFISLATNCLNKPKHYNKFEATKYIILTLTHEDVETDLIKEHRYYGEIIYFWQSMYSSTRYSGANYSDETQEQKERIKCLEQIAGLITAQLHKHNLALSIPPRNPSRD